MRLSRKDISWSGGPFGLIGEVKAPDGHVLRHAGRPREEIIDMLSRDLEARIDRLKRPKPRVAQ